jgi:hypothetical protein
MEKLLQYLAIGYLLALLEKIRTYIVLANDMNDGIHRAMNGQWKKTKRSNHTVPSSAFNLELLTMLKKCQTDLKTDAKISITEGARDLVSPEIQPKEYLNCSLIHI